MNLREQALNNTLESIRQVNPSLHSYLMSQLQPMRLAGLGQEATAAKKSNIFSDAGAQLWDIFRGGLNTAVQSEAERKAIEAEAKVQLEKARIAAQQAEADARAAEALSMARRAELAQEAIREQQAIDAELAKFGREQIFKVAAIGVALFGAFFIGRALLKG